jgi:excinuclease ABC subunit C
VASPFPSSAFFGFGPSAHESAPAPLVRVQGKRAGALGQAVREWAQRRPGVYGMLDESNQLIYVGKAKNLRSRLLSYFRRKSRDPKAGRIISRTRSIVWEHVPSEFAALLRELELIRRWRPRYNTMGQPGRGRPIYICLGRQPAPYVFLAHIPPRASRSVFGPISAGPKASEAVRRLNDCLRLRDCPSHQTMIFADDRELFPLERSPGCIRFDIGTCLAPCAAACTREAYRKQARAAQRFLSGRDTSALAGLRQRMEACVKILAFEQAAALRDQLNLLEWLYHRLDRVRQARAGRCFVYPVPGHAAEDRWYLIHHGVIVGVYENPKRAANSGTLRAALDCLAEHKLPPGSSPTLRSLENVLLVAGWLRRHPAENERTMDYATARAFLSVEA